MSRAVTTLGTATALATRLVRAGAGRAPRVAVHDPRAGGSTRSSRPPRRGSLRRPLPARHHVHRDPARRVEPAWATGRPSPPPGRSTQTATRRRGASARRRPTREVHRVAERQPHQAEPELELHLRRSQHQLGRQLHRVARQRARLDLARRRAAGLVREGPLPLTAACDDVGATPRFWRGAHVAGWGAAYAVSLRRRPRAAGCAAPSRTRRW